MRYRLGHRTILYQCILREQRRHTTSITLYGRFITRTVRIFYDSARRGFATVLKVGDQFFDPHFLASEGDKIDGVMHHGPHARIKTTRR